MPLPLDNAVSDVNLNRPSIGPVYLVGAGPGDPGMLTLRAVECLGRADVVLHDYLAATETLRHARPGARIVSLGRHGQGKLWTQDEINERMIAEATSGAVVVRLKSGDPSVFGRMAEELTALRRHGVPYEIVPGVTAALSAAATAEIPLTHRDSASAVAFVTGHEKPDKDLSALDWSALARFPGTLVFYMGVTTAEQWVGELVAHGMAPDTPAAIVRRASRPDQLVLRCRLDEVVDRLHHPRVMRPPILAIVGPAAAAGADPSWFERRPLFGTTVLVTRAEHQAAALVEPLRELGAEVLVQPTIEIRPPADMSTLDATLARLNDFDWVAFSSRNGVEAFLTRLSETGRDARALGGCRLAAIGPGTMEELARWRLKCDLAPDGEFRAESLAAALAPHAVGKRCLLVRASRGRETLAEMLAAAGATVEQVVAYASVDVERPDPDIAARMATGEIDWTLTTSSAIARSVARMFGETLRATRLASISPVTSETLRELGLSPTVEATSYTMPGLVAALRAAVERE